MPMDDGSREPALATVATSVRCTRCGRLFPLVWPEPRDEAGDAPFPPVAAPTEVTDAWDLCEPCRAARWRDEADRPAT